MANNICIESKKKNMTSKEMDAPRGRQRACIVSSVWTPVLTSRTGVCVESGHPNEEGIKRSRVCVCRVKRVITSG